MSLICLLFVTLFCGISDQEQAEVAAKVDGFEISCDRVNRHLQKTLGKKVPKGSLLKIARMEAIDHLVDRHVIFQYLEDNGYAIGDSQVIFERSKLEDRLAEISKTLDDYLQENHMTTSELNYEFRWRLAWRKYLEKQLTNDNLRSYFEKHRRKFDGTKIQIAHILLEDDEEAIKRAQEIRNEIVGGEISWNDAASKYSISTSSAGNGGEVGWVDFYGPMSPEVCQAATLLRRQEISKPVRSNFGVHLVKCLDIRPGKIGPADAREELKKDAMKFLFESLARKHRASSSIEILLGPDTKK